jgi:hypothetical protein
MTTEQGMEAPGYVPADLGSEETLSFPLVVLLHLLPGMLLMGAVLLLTPPLIERGVPYDLAHIASALLTMVPFVFGAMLLYGRRKHGRLTLRGVVRFRGFLLPRMGYMGVLVPAANALLFAAAHYWQRYNWSLIFLLVLVNAYVVWWKRNIYIAMLLHCSANTIGAALSLLAFFSR